MSKRNCSRIPTCVYSASARGLSDATPSWALVSPAAAYCANAVSSIAVARPRRWYSGAHGEKVDEAGVLDGEVAAQQEAGDPVAGVGDDAERGDEVVGLEVLLAEGIERLGVKVGVDDEAGRTERVKPLMVAIGVDVPEAVTGRWRRRRHPGPQLDRHPGITTDAGIAGGEQELAPAEVGRGDPLPVAVAAPFAFAALCPVQQQRTDPAALVGGRDHDQRPGRRTIA